jgi:hypothetical protein
MTLLEQQPLRHLPHLTRLEKVRYFTHTILHPSQREDQTWSARGTYAVQPYCLESLDLMKEGAVLWVSLQQAYAENTPYDHEYERILSP